MAGLRRKRGDWIAVANGRKHRETALVNGRGVSNIPRPGTEVGSAAYRRSKAVKTAKKWGGDAEDH